MGESYSMVIQHMMVLSDPIITLLINHNVRLLKMFDFFFFERKMFELYITETQLTWFMKQNSTNKLSS